MSTLLRPPIREWPGVSAHYVLINLPLNRRDQGKPDPTWKFSGISEGALGCHAPSTGRVPAKLIWAVGPVWVQVTAGS